MRKNVLIGLSGGPSAAINASMAGVIRAAAASARYGAVYGALHGIAGVLNREVIDLAPYSDEESLRLLIQTPAMSLGSCRKKLTAADWPKIEQVLTDYGVGVFFYIGGNDSMDTVAKLSAYAASIGNDIRIIGVPKTIDNDLIMTDHTPGFGSAAKYIASSIREIAYDTYIYDLESVNIIEIMGRDAGWLTAASVLARNEFSLAPHLIYLPEVAFDKEQFITDLKEMVKKYKNVIVAVSEGIRDKDGNYISATDAAADKFGHAQLSGAGKTLEYLVKEKLGIKVRSVEVNVLQLCAGHMASMTDLTESFLSGKHAVVLAKNGESAQMVSLHRLSNAPYTYELSNTPVSEVANQAKEVPVSWITPDHHDVTAEMIAYLKPLVAGEVPTDYADGIADYLDVSHLTKVYGK